MFSDTLARIDRTSRLLRSPFAVAHLARWLPGLGLVRVLYQDVGAAIAAHIVLRRRPGGDARHVSGTSLDPNAAHGRFALPRRVTTAGGSDLTKRRAHGQLVVAIGLLADVVNGGALVAADVLGEILGGHRGGHRSASEQASSRR